MKGKEKYTALLSDTIVFAIGNFGIKIISLFLMPLYTLTLSPNEYGTADLMLNALYLIVPILTLNIYEATFRFSLEKNADYTSILSGSACVAAISSIAAISLCCVLSFVLNQPLFLLGGLMFVSEAFRWVFAQYIRGLGKSRLFAFSGILSVLVLLSSSFVFLYFLHLGINGYVLAYIFANLCSIALLFARGSLSSHVSFSRCKPVITKMLTYSIPLIPNTVSWWFINMSSRYILACVCGVGLSGMFASACKMAALISIFSTIFQQSWQYASVKEMQDANEKSFYEQVFNKYSLFLFVAGALLIMLTPFLSRIILRGSFYGAWIYSPLLLFSAILSCFSVFFGNFYTMRLKSKGLMTTTIAGGAANVFICFIAIPAIGAWGALAANIISYLIMTALRVKGSKRLVGFSVSMNRACIGLSLLLAESVLMSVRCQYGIISGALALVLIIVMYFRDMRDLASVCRLR